MWIKAHKAVSFFFRPLKPWRCNHAEWCEDFGSAAVHHSVHWGTPTEQGKGVDWAARRPQGAASAPGKGEMWNLLWKSTYPLSPFTFMFRVKSILNGGPNCTLSFKNYLRRKDWLTQWVESHLYGLHRINSICCIELKIKLNDFLKIWQDVFKPGHCPNWPQTKTPHSCKKCCHF